MVHKDPPKCPKSGLYNVGGKDGRLRKIGMKGIREEERRKRDRLSQREGKGKG